MIDMRIKHMFFDRPRVVAAVDRTKRKALSRGGAFVRQSAKTSIRKRKGSAPPGKPPRSHEGSLRRLILFGYDRRTDQRPTPVTVPLDHFLVKGTRHGLCETAIRHPFRMHDARGRSSGRARRRSLLPA